MSVNPSKFFALKRPCADCPFRSDLCFPLGTERREDIADSLRNGASFTCHKTFDYDSDDGGGKQTDKSAFCAGALITMEKEEAPNNIMRVSERLGLYDHTRLRMDSPTFDSLQEWQDAEGDES